MWPLSQWTLVDARLRLVGAREVEHLVGHVEAVGGAGRGDAAGGEQDVDAAAGAEVEHGHAVAQIGHRGRVAAPERREQRCIGQLVLLRAVEAGAEQLGLLVGDDRAVARAATSCDRVAARRREGSGGVALADGLAQRVRIGQTRSRQRSSRSCRRRRWRRSRQPCRSTRNRSPVLRAHNRRKRWARRSGRSAQPCGQLLQGVGEDVVVGPQPAALGVDDAGLAQLLEMMRERGLGDVEQRHQLADADLARRACAARPRAAGVPDRRAPWRPPPYGARARARRRDRRPARSTARRRGAWSWGRAPDRRPSISFYLLK